MLMETSGRARPTPGVRSLPGILCCGHRHMLDSLSRAKLIARIRHSLCAVPHLSVIGTKHTVYVRVLRF